MNFKLSFGLGLDPFLFSLVVNNTDTTKYKSSKIWNVVYHACPVPGNQEEVGEHQKKKWKQLEKEQDTAW